MHSVPLDVISPKHVLERYGLRAKKSFGQNFLADAHLVDKIARLAGEPEASVVEIGAGLGSLTLALLRHGHTVAAIERDRDLIPVLHDFAEASPHRERLRIVEADAKTVDYLSLFDAESRKVLIGNIPYHLTGPLLRTASQLADFLERVVLLVQLEVADRLSASPDTEHYGALSVFTQAAFAVERAFLVRRGAFYPQPRVDSAVVLLEPRPPPRMPETDAFRALVKAAFTQRRKTLQNAWKPLFPRDPARLQAAAKAAHIDLQRRGETLHVEDFHRMSEQLGRLDSLSS